MSVYNNIINGKYNPSAAIPARPAKPALLRMNVSKLTDDELAGIPAIRDKYEADKAEYDVVIEARRKEQGVLLNQFQIDLEEEFEVTDHPKADLLYEKAWGRGHSGGLAEVYSAYAEMVGLIQ